VESFLFEKSAFNRGEKLDICGKKYRQGRFGHSRSVLTLLNIAKLLFWPAKCSSFPVPFQPSAFAQRFESNS